MNGFTIVIAQFGPYILDRAMHTRHEMTFVRQRKHVAIGMLALLLGGVGCRPYTVSSGRPSIAWSDITPSAGPLPSGITIFEGYDDRTPLHAWYARIETTAPDIDVRVVFSDEEDNKETTSSMANDLGACVSVNAGYFLAENEKARHIGLLVSSGEMIRGATSGIFRDDIRYEVARASIGFLGNGIPEIAWVTSVEDSVFAWTDPPLHKAGAPDGSLASGVSRFWPVVHAVAAGPSLVRDGTRYVTIDEEIFFDSPIPNVHPRTAAGITVDGSLLLVVVDGRQSLSRGVNLSDLAGIMLDLGAVNALNLDGGGSSSFVVNGKLLNRPAGETTEREVVSAISVFCEMDR